MSDRANEDVPELVASNAELAEEWRTIVAKMPRLVECDACPTSGGCVETCMKAPVEKQLSQRFEGGGEQTNLEYCP